MTARYRAGSRECGHPGTGRDHRRVHRAAEPAAHGRVPPCRTAARPGTHRATGGDVMGVHERRGAAAPPDPAAARWHARRAGRLRGHASGAPLDTVGNCRRTAERQRAAVPSRRSGPRRRAASKGPAATRRPRSGTTSRSSTPARSSSSWPTCSRRSRKAKAAVAAIGGYIGASQESNDGDRAVATITLPHPGHPLGGRPRPRCAASPPRSSPSRRRPPRSAASSWTSRPGSGTCGRARPRSSRDREGRRQGQRPARGRGAADRGPRPDRAARRPARPAHRPGRLRHAGHDVRARDRGRPGDGQGLGPGAGRGRAPPRR